MDPRRFDSLTRSLAAPRTRRGLLGGLAALGAGLLGSRPTGAQVTQGQCGNVVCFNRGTQTVDVACAPGCVCCVYGNGNSRCQPAGSCGGTVVGPATTTTTAAPSTTTTTAAPTTTTLPACAPTGTACSPGLVGCCSAADVCFQGPIGFGCFPAPTTTTTSTTTLPACAPTGTACSPGVVGCCSAADVCFQGPIGFGCFPAPTTTTAPPTCLPIGQVCSPTSGLACCEPLSCADVVGTFRCTDLV